jgi:hypothetical protein
MLDFYRYNRPIRLYFVCAETKGLDFNLTAVHIELVRVPQCLPVSGFTDMSGTISRLTELSSCTLDFSLQYTAVA